MLFQGLSIMKAPFKPNVFTVFLIAGRIFLGSIFVYASWSKILDPAAFAEIVMNYQILPTMSANLVALSLPWLEMVCGLCLITNFWTRGGAMMVVLMMLIFISAMGLNIYRGIDVACGCFTLTGTATQSMWIYLLRDMALLFLAIAVLMLPKAHLPVTVIFKSSTSNEEAKRHVA